MEMDKPNKPKMNRLDNLEDLLNFKSFFSNDNTDKSEEPLIDDNLEDDLLEKDFLSGAIQNYTVRILNNSKSIRLKKQKFSNFILDSSNTSFVNSKVIDLFKFNNRTIDIDELPLASDSPIQKNNRINTILNEIGVDTTQHLTKWKYTDASMSGILASRDGDLLRIITHTRDTEFFVVLVDPFHLFATTDYHNYKEASKYNACLSQLFNHING